MRFSGQLNVEACRKLVGHLIDALPRVREPSPIDNVLDFALITDPGERDPGLVRKLDAVAGRVLVSNP